MGERGLSRGITTLAGWLTFGTLVRINNPFSMPPLRARWNHSESVVGLACCLTVCREWVGFASRAARNNPYFTPVPARVRGHRESAFPHR